jgi:hypothetical protein
MFKRVPQPPLDSSLRARESHDFWPGFAVLLIGAALTFCGARHLTGVDTVDGNSARETQLVKAFTSGGLQYPDQIAPVPPPRLDDSANPGEALDRWAKQQAHAQLPAWKVRVDAGAKTPCPT